MTRQALVARPRACSYPALPATPPLVFQDAHGRDFPARWRVGNQGVWRCWWSATEPRGRLGSFPEGLVAFPAGMERRVRLCWAPCENFLALKNKGLHRRHAGLALLVFPTNGNHHLSRARAVRRPSSPALCSPSLFRGATAAICHALPRFRARQVTPCSPPVPPIFPVSFSGHDCRDLSRPFHCSRA